MILTIFRPKRNKDGKTVVSRSYRGRYRLDGDSKIADVPLHTTDKRVAQQRLEKIVQEKQFEAEGILPPQSIRAASLCPLEKHLKEYIADLQKLGRDEEYIYIVTKQINRLFAECHWKQIKDVTADSFIAWRSNQKKAPKTLNEYLASMSAFLHWMERLERIARNPFKTIAKVQRNDADNRCRRAFTREEFTQLLAIAGPRKVVYLAAVFTGLRRAELEQLEWGDVHLDVEKPFLNVRASTTKNHKRAVIYLHPDLIAELKAILPTKPHPKDRVFSGRFPSRMVKFKADLKAAKIDYVNAQGQRADFHSLRYTLATYLALAGTQPRVAMEVMRHSDMRLTANIYTDLGLLPTSDAVLKLPSFTGITSTPNDSQIDSQSLSRKGQSQSGPVTKSFENANSQYSDNEEDGLELSVAGATSPENENGCRARTRT